MDAVKSKLNAEAQGEVLQAFSKTLQREIHNLSPHPDILWQQLHNRLQWVEGPMVDIVSVEREKRSHPGSKLWLRLFTPLRESESLSRVLTGHNDWIDTCAYSPDGSTLASGSHDNTVRLWDAYTYDEISVLTGHSSAVRSCAFSPDSRILASASDDKTIRLWDVHTWEEIAVLNGHTDRVESCAFSPDGRTLASASFDTSVRLWDVHSGEELASFTVYAGWVSICAFSPNGHILASANVHNKVRIWDLRTGEETAILSGHNDQITSCVFSPDGHILASTSYDNSIRLWNTQTWEEIAILSGHTDRVLSCAFSPDGSTLATGSRDKTIRLWDTFTGKVVDVLFGHSYEVRSCAFSPDGLKLASASGDNTVRLWDISNVSESNALLGHRYSILSCVFSPDNRILASSSMDETIRLWNPQTGEQIDEFEIPTDGVRKQVFSPDGRISASTFWGGTISLWDLNKREEIASLSGHTGDVNSLAFSPDGRILASGSDDETIRLWDVCTGEEMTVLSGGSGKVNFCAFSPSGQILASICGNYLHLWDILSYSRCGALALQTYSISICTFSPDGRVLAFAGSEKPPSGKILDLQYGIVRLWDTQNREEMTFLKSLIGTIDAITFSPDGGILATASRDKTIRLWDSRTAEPLATFPCLGESGNCDFNSQGTKFAAGDTGGNVYILEIVGMELKPVFITPQREAKTLLIRCPACLQEHQIIQDQLGSEMKCPGCSTALRVNPFSSSSIDIKKIKQFKEDLETLEECLKLDDKNITAWTTRAQTFSELKNYQGALESYLRVRELEWTEETEAMIGMCYLHLDDTVNAEAILKSLVEGGSQHPLAFYCYGLCLLMMDETEQGCKWLQRFIENPGEGYQSIVPQAQQIAERLC